MLEKIEAAYLAAMRVIVLIAATLALIVAVIGVVNAAPMIGKQLGFGGAKRVEGADLGTFIAEQRAAGTPVDSSVEGGSSPDQSAPPKIVQASQAIAKYASTRLQTELETPELVKFLAERQAELDAEYREAYADSLVAFAADLNNSTGKPLAWERVGQGIDWHFSRFKSEIEMKKIEAEAAKAKAMLGLAMAGGAILAFLIILFFFLFVKIERNLRLVRTREVAA